MIIQGTPEWHVARSGMFTASKAFTLMGKTKLGVTGETYIIEQVAEGLTGQCEEMDLPNFRWGEKYEPYAFNHYEEAFNCELVKDGFKVSAFDENVGGSPDALIKRIRKGVEFKCPAKQAVHLKYLLLKDVEDLKLQYPLIYWQCIQLMLCYNYEAWDFVSYHHAYKGHLKMSALHIPRNESDIKLLKERLSQALDIRGKILLAIENKQAV